MKLDANPKIINSPSHVHVLVIITFCGFFFIVVSVISLFSVVVLFDEKTHNKRK